MILKMANPWKHPLTGVYYYRQRPPALFRERLKGQRLGLIIDGKPVPVLVRDLVKVSLRTKEANPARERFRDVSAQVDRLYRAFDGDAFTLSHEQVTQLAGEWYRSIVGAYRANPGDAEGWDVELHRVGEALEHFVPEDDPDYPSRDRLPYNPERGEQLIGQYLKPDLFLQERGLRLSPQSRLAFLREAGGAHMAACHRLIRHAGGDYGKDDAEQRFPSEPFKRQSEDSSADI